jgi:thiol:disulfide interchange protein/DsbC/DsbD-like thiol-disulfide interchange protein
MPASSMNLLRQTPRRATGWFVLACGVLLYLTLALAAPPATAQSFAVGSGNAAVSRSEQVLAELVAHAPEGVAPGRRVWVGLRLEHTPGWHTYWKNPGDSGLPTELRWQLPPGVSAGEIAWPTPRKFPIEHLANYGYEGVMLLPVPLHIGTEFQGESLDVGLEASWLVCRKECIPGEASLRLRIPTQGVTAAHGPLFDDTLAAVPVELPAGTGHARPEGDSLAVSVEGLPAAWHGKSLEFFPEAPGIIEPGAAWTQGWEGGRWSARIPLSAQRADAPDALPVVLSLADGEAAGPGDAPAGVRQVLPVRGGWPAVAATTGGELPPALQAALEANAAAAAATTPAPSGNALTLGAALASALLGGLILNLMPCVFPVLAIKVLAFARDTDDRAGHRRNGLAYTAGTVLSFLALGGLLLALRAAGQAVGWGFQLQSPATVAALATLFTLIGLNLAGLFEIGNVVPARLASLQARNPTVDAFLTGVLAVAVAAPCTAPFMGASLGLAITLPAWQALAVFALLGLGMALPYLAASWWPAIARGLPRPGPWMLTFRQFMAFPMFGTVIWLLWVLGQQTSIDGAAALLALLLVLALLVWALGLRGRGRAVLAGVAALALLWLGSSLGPNVVRPAAAQPTGTATAIEGLAWEPWSPEREAALLAEGRTVFVDYTAAWCVTCQYNKRTTLADTALLTDLARRQVALLRADWTRHDPAITAALARLGRSGVPVYVLHKAGQPPQVLTEILTVDEVRTALDRLT